MRTFSRSLKSHRSRGLYCGTGDCANCILTVDGIPGARACVTAARDGMRVERETGWPSTERDMLAINDRLHRAMPVGFYYKVFARPRWLWPLAERVIRRATGTGTLPRSARRPAQLAPGTPASTARDRRRRRRARRRGERRRARPARRRGRARRAGERPGDPSRRSLGSRSEARAAGVGILEQHAAIGVYDGPSVPLVGPEELVEVEADRVIVATGALEAHGVFPGNDLPGVWLARGAARMAAGGVRSGERAVVVANTDEGERAPPSSARRAPTSPLVAGRVLEARRREAGLLGGRADARGQARPTRATRWRSRSAGRRGTASFG